MSTRPLLGRHGGSSPTAREAPEPFARRRTGCRQAGSARPSNSHFGVGGRRWRGLADFWGVEGTWSGRARWWPEEGQGFEKLGPGREHEIAGQALQVLEKAGAWPERLAGVPPGS